MLKSCKIYEPLQGYLNAIIQSIQSGEMRLIIISAGYGIVDAFEPLHEYNAVLSGQTARYWRNQGLVNIIKDLILTAKPSHVYGFFTGSPYWSSGSKYRYFFTEGLKTAIQDGLRMQLSGCFYRVRGPGLNALRALGQVFIRLCKLNFDPRFALNVQRNPIAISGVTIGFDRIQ